MEREKNKGIARKWGLGTKIKQSEDTTATDAITLSIAKKIRGSTIVGTNRTCSNRRN